MFVALVRVLKCSFLYLSCVLWVAWEGGSGMVEEVYIICKTFRLRIARECYVHIVFMELHVHVRVHASYTKLLFGCCGSPLHVHVCVSTGL